MHRQTTRVARQVRVNINTLNAGRDQWARISDAKTGQILHTGQVKYIRRIARKRYNVEV